GHRNARPAGSSHGHDRPGRGASGREPRRPLRPVRDGRCRRNAHTRIGPSPPDGGATRNGTMEARTESRMTGALLVAGAALFWSTGGPISRRIRGGEDWTIAFWRAVFVVAALVVVLAIMERGRVFGAFMRAGWRGLASGACFGVMMTGF